MKYRFLLKLCYKWLTQINNNVASTKLWFYYLENEVKNNMTLHKYSMNINMKTVGHHLMSLLINVKKSHAQNRAILLSCTSNLTLKEAICQCQELPLPDKATSC